MHFIRNLLATVSHAAPEPVAALVRTIFAQPEPATALAQLRKVSDGLWSRFPQAAALLEEAVKDVLADLHFPIAHRRRLHSTNPLERPDKEIKRRPAVVGMFPPRGSLWRVVGAVLAEQRDEWAVADRCYFSVASMPQLALPLAAETRRSYQPQSRRRASGRARTEIFTS